MKDQAARLREIIENRRQHPDRIVKDGLNPIAIMSGKGGVGKSFFSVQLAAALTDKGARVLLIDANLNTPSLHVLTNTTPLYTVRQALHSGLKPTKASFTSLNEGWDLFPNEEPDNASQEGIQHNIFTLLDFIRRIHPPYHHIILDTQTGLNGWNVSILQAAASVVVVSFNEPTAIIDTYTFLKAARLFTSKAKFQVLFNQLLTLTEGEEAHRKLNMALEHFLKFTVPLTGMIPFDLELKEAISRQAPFWEEGFDIPARQAVEKIATMFLQSTPAEGSDRESQPLNMER